ncbi:hypothetical protein OH76DRAFT_1012351 [Lentinus brumalis]|uniref:Uncharacterized protein n=1 Tax=Lentinus brumalis TaxID=2498619 RepID=A0A371CYC8_9APHY|nr:hypothetical protein OH76DRAFT_1012351 [Polyporus brumalis]
MRRLPPARLSSGAGWLSRGVLLATTSSTMYSGTIHSLPPSAQCSPSTSRDPRTGKHGTYLIGSDVHIASHIWRCPSSFASLTSPTSHPRPMLSSGPAVLSIPPAVRVHAPCSCVSPCMDLLDGPLTEARHSVCVEWLFWSRSLRLLRPGLYHVTVSAPAPVESIIGLRFGTLREAEDVERILLPAPSIYSGAVVSLLHTESITRSTRRIRPALSALASTGQASLQATILSPRSPFSLHSNLSTVLSFSVWIPYSDAQKSAISDLVSALGRIPWQTWG